MQAERRYRTLRTAKHSRAAEQTRTGRLQAFLSPFWQQETACLASGQLSMHLAGPDLVWGRMKKLDPLRASAVASLSPQKSLQSLAKYIET